MTQKEKQIQLLMDKLEINRAEAEDVYLTDLLIDSGFRTKYDFSLEKERECTKFCAFGGQTEEKRQAAAANRGKKMTKSEKKAEIISKIAEIFGQNCEITNENRQIALHLDGIDYEITLVQKSKKK